MRIDLLCFPRTLRPTMPASSPGQRTDLFDDNNETISMEYVKVNGFGSPHDSDDEVEDNGDVALLRSSPQPRFSSPAGLWSQTKDIVLEVGTSSSYSCRSLIASQECPNFIAYDYQFTIHWKIAGSSLCMSSLLAHMALSDSDQRWRAMQEVDQLIMIIPVVLNLKGNLEMNLSARLGTAANVGELNEPKQRRVMIIGNLALLQVQAAVVSFVAACIAIILGLFVPHGDPAAPSPSNNSTATIALLVRDHLPSYNLESRKPIPHPLPESKRNTDLAT